jgi:hypothetical protein
MYADVYARLALGVLERSGADKKATAEVSIAICFDKTLFGFGREHSDLNAELSLIVLSVSGRSA